jgi:hypothetical protein
MWSFKSLGEIVYISEANLSISQGYRAEFVVPPESAEIVKIFILNLCLVLCTQLSGVQ